ncbi:MAG: 1-acyl-sn-glycerol-3-phosphate acyltransferase [Wenzhouxiangella sp.]
MSKLFEKKNPALHQRLPRSVMTLISRLLRCQYINRELYNMRAIPCRRFPRATLDHLGVELRVDGSVPDPSVSRPVFIANHPLGGLDGLAMLSWMLEQYEQVKVPANDVLATFPHLRPVVAPINQFGSQRNNVNALHECFASSTAILVFPAGRTSRPAIVGGRLSDHPWRKMAVRMARIHQRPLVPVFVSGRNSGLFYGIYHLRRWLGIRTNLEMFLLVREMMRPATHRVALHFGRPIEPSELETLGADDQQRTLRMREMCYCLEPSFHSGLMTCRQTQAQPE